MIDVENLYLIYPNGKGVYDLTFSVDKGEVMGYLGPNGAGKTTTIRALLGFMQPNSGTCSIGGLDCIRKAPEIQRFLGYIPGEIAFLDSMNGDEFLTFMHAMRGTKDLSRQNQLLEMFELDPKGSIKKFSKGMKQKLGIVTAFMHDPDLLILDEPTSGLDPLMQNRFVELVLDEKARGKTILMSSHMFEEVERTCDNVLIIKDGRIVQQSDVQSLKNSQHSGFILKPQDVASASLTLESAGFLVGESTHNTIEVYVKEEDIDRFIKIASQSTILGLDVIPQTLESIFMQYYGREQV
ncbi:MAG: ABC transporter ATP-binding protein [Anaerolineae bacterium]